MDREEEWLLSEKYRGEKSEAFFADLARLKMGEPLAYLIGHTPFLNVKIRLDSHPLIPRPETEHWVERAIVEIKSTSIAEPRVLDLCAGSGCIGVAVANAISNAHADFAEIDERHHATIRKNIETNGIDLARTRIFGGDLFENITDRFDFILSNPPYIDPALDRAEPSVKTHEPHQALYGGEDGLELIARIIAAASAYLTDNGQLWIEHEPEQSKTIQELALEQGFTAATYNDQYGIERYSIIMFSRVA